jgi:hypothetical protein
VRKMLWLFVGIIVVVLGALGAVLAFDVPVKPPPLASVSEPFANVDFSDLPAVRTYPARDGTKLGYRVYDGGGAQAVVLIHGSSDDGAGVHPLAKALRDARSTFRFCAAMAISAAAAISIISASSRTISPISWRCCDRCIPALVFP